MDATGDVKVTLPTDFLWVARVAENAAGERIVLSEHNGVMSARPLVVREEDGSLWMNLDGEDQPVYGDSMLRGAFTIWKAIQTKIKDVPWENPDAPVADLSRYQRLQVLAFRGESPVMGSVTVTKIGEVEITETFVKFGDSPEEGILGKSPVHARGDNQRAMCQPTISVKHLVTDYIETVTCPKCKVMVDPPDDDEEDVDESIYCPTER